MPRRSAAWPSRLALLLATLVAIALVGEIAARIWTFVPVESNDASDEPVPATRHPGLPRLTSIFDIGKKNVRGIYQGVFFRTNSQGVRGPEYPLTPEPGVFRILITGDSVTMGWAVEEASTYAQRLGGLLDEARPGRRHEVINAGLAGINARFANQRLAMFADIYQPDLLIYGFTLNDIEGPHYAKLPEPTSVSRRKEIAREAFRFQNGPSALLRQLWPLVIFSLHRDAFEDIDHSAAQRDEWLYNYFENEAAWKDFVSGLDLLAETAAAHGVCGHVLVHTHLSHLQPKSENPYWPIYERVAEAARARGLTVTQSLPYFAGREPDGLRVNAFDLHPNANGHRLLAEALRDGLVHELPEDCWQR